MCFEFYGHTTAFALHDPANFPLVIPLVEPKYLPPRQL